MKILGIWFLCSLGTAAFWWLLCVIDDAVTKKCQGYEDPSHPGAYAPPARRLAGLTDHRRAPRPHRWGARPRARVAGPRARRAR